MGGNQDSCRLMAKAFSEDLGTQIIGKLLIKPAVPASIGIFFIPLIFVLPKFYGELGMWMSFPISDVLATGVTLYFLHREVKLNL